MKWTSLKWKQKQNKKINKKLFLAFFCSFFSPLRWVRNAAKRADFLFLPKKNSSIKRFILSCFVYYLTRLFNFIFSTSVASGTISRQMPGDKTKCLSMNWDIEQFWAVDLVLSSSKYFFLHFKRKENSIHNRFWFPKQ